MVPPPYDADGYPVQIAMSLEQFGEKGKVFGPAAEMGSDPRLGETFEHFFERFVLLKFGAVDL